MAKIISWEKIAYRPPSATPAPAPVVIPTGPPATKSPNLVSRARSKYMSMHMASELASLNSPLKFSYLNTLKCGNTITQNGKVLTSTYCGNRWCLVCSRIRTGKMINKYERLLESFSDAQFVTLTIRNIGRDVKEVRDVQNKMYSICRKIQDVLRKDNIVIKGVRKFEPIPSRDGKGVHPHFHWIIEGYQADETAIAAVWKKQKLPIAGLRNLVALRDKGQITFGQITGELIIQMWLKYVNTVTTISAEGKATKQRIKNVFSERCAQDCKKADKNSLMELFKYTTKLLTRTKQQVTKKGKTKDVWSHVIPVKTLDIIYQAVRGARTIQVTGYQMRKPKLITGATDLEKERYNTQLAEYNLYKSLTAIETEAIECDLKGQEYPDLQSEEGAFEWRGNNWYNIYSYQPLIKFEVDKEINRFIESFEYG